MILIFTAALASPSPSPAPTAVPDPCGGEHTNLLAALNRPSIGFSPCAVKPHEGVIEAGYANAAGDTGSLATYPQGFVRYGGAPNFEVDAIAGGRFDSGFGAKYEFWHDDARVLAADFLYTLPTGTAALTAGGPTQTLNLDYTMPLSSRFGLASTLGMQSDYAATPGGTSGRFFSVLPSLVLSDQWNPRAQAFIEAFGQTRTRPDGGAQFGLDAAFQYLLAPQLEIDLEIGRTANDVSRSHFFGFGFGARF
ncbi:MAG TPA: transporter [Candidatus Baltobacteraceae bacterium]|nr:transporter [Candidatus Baltobacteraceae bacterium]